MAGLTADTACASIGWGLDDLSEFARTTTLLGFGGDISGDVDLRFVFGSLRATALLGWFRRGDVLSDFLSDREDHVGDLLGEVISAAVGSGDIKRDVINKVFDFFHECDGKKRCVRRHDRRISR